MKSSVVQSSPVQYSLIQSSPVQSSPVQYSLIQSSPVQSSVMLSPVKPSFVYWHTFFQNFSSLKIFLVEVHQERETALLLYTKQHLTVKQHSNLESKSHFSEMSFHHILLQWKDFTTLHILHSSSILIFTQDNPLHL